MKRRSFFRMAAGSAGMLWTSGLERSLQALAQGPASSAVRRVLVMFKCHFDAGFIDTQTAVVHKYFSQYFPQAIRVAQQSREPGQHRYVWTTG
ncbi:MAG TPA: hypothetical protein VHE33_01290, partial [Acidobacteriaceae bacterium]|nr:hypothetical protein [Acidobacteriaceae bacterium]